jgi:hypothetical protein
MECAFNVGENSEYFKGHPLSGDRMMRLQSIFVTQKGECHD